MAVPRYRVLSDTFIAPMLIRAGSTIETDGPPGNHLDPLNPEAEERMEDWYTQEVLFYDEKGKKVKIGETPEGKPIWQTYQPHMEHRIRRFEPGTAQIATVVSDPPRDMVGSMSLSEVLIQQPSVDPRPGPAVPRKVPQLEESAPAVAVVEEGKPKTTVKSNG